jgi:hypothetical protein
MVKEIQKKYYKQANISRAAHLQKTNDLKQSQQLLQRQDTTQ